MYKSDLSHLPPHEKTQPNFLIKNYLKRVPSQGAKLFAPTQFSMQ